MILLTQSNVFLIGPISRVLGYIMNALFLALDAIGIANIGLAIILFTIVVKLIMLPLAVKQQKYTKLTAIMNPEIQALTKKYKGKNDQESMLKRNEEQKAIYAKYGTSPTGGCLQIFIQMPILFALYKVVQSVPAYVPSLKALFTNILGNSSEGIMSTPDFAEKMTSIFGENDYTHVGKIIDTMTTFGAAQWDQLKELFPSFTELINSNMNEINRINNFMGINMSQSPGFVIGITMIIPILAGLTQWLSVKLQQSTTAQNMEDNPAAASMKMMTLVMPVMSAVFAFSLPAGLGLYWTATAVVQIVMQLIINRYLDKVGVDSIIQSNIDKQNKKRAKKGLPPQKINVKAQATSIDTLRDRTQRLQEKKEQNDKKVKEILESTEYYKTGRSGSLAEKAGMVQKYNEKNIKK